jgi:hypothetical protein
VPFIALSGKHNLNKTQLLKGLFTLARFRGRFCTKLARLEMKTKKIVTKHASLMQNRAQKSQM